MSVIVARNPQCISSSRGSMHGVMANSGFGAMTIYRKDGAVIELPQSMINKAGFVKTKIAKDLEELTIEKVQELEKRGVKLYVGKAD